MATIDVKVPINDLRSTFTYTHALQGFAGDDLQFELPKRHNIVSASISWAGFRLTARASTEAVTIVEWAIIAPAGPDGGKTVSNGGVEPIGPGNFGLLRLDGDAKAAFAGGKDVVVQIEVAVPTGRIGRDA